MNKYILSFLGILLTLFLFSSCKKDKSNIRNEKLFIYDTYQKNKINWNRLVLFHYEKSKNHYDYDLSSKCNPDVPNKIYQCASAYEIKLFDNLLKNAEKTGYCCCPHSNYTLTMYNNTTEYDNFVIDTIENKDKVRIFQTSYQYSFLVKKNNWADFLKKISKLNSKKYDLTNLNTARKIYNLTNKNNLNFITNNYSSKYWMYFSGSFDAQISSNEEELDGEKIIKEIKNKYPNYKFKIDIGSSDISQNEDGDLIKSTTDVTIYCNKDLYDKFAVFKTKKYLFQETKAQFYIIGSEKELDNFEKELTKI